MVGLREAVGNIGRGFLCSALDASDGVDRWIETLRRGGTSVPGPDPGDRAAQSRALGCDPDFGGGAGGGGGAGATFPTPPAGQCPVAYSISAQIQLVRQDGSISSTSSVVTVSEFSGSGDQIFGPIGGPTVVPYLSGTQERARLEYTGLDSAGNARTGQIFDSPVGGGRTMEVLLFQPNRLDGQADDCGEVPPDESGPSGSGDITYDGPDGNPVTEPYDIVGGPPVLAPNGDLVFPFEICIAALCFDFDINLSTGDISFNFGGDPGQSPCCPPIEDVPDDEQNEPEDPDPPQDAVRYVGVVTRAQIPSAGGQWTEVGGGDGPSLYIPRIGVIRFAIAIGGVTSYTVDQPIKQLSQFTEVNAPTPAYSWTILPEPGVVISATGIPVKEE